MPQGTAKDLGTPFWEIVDSGGVQLVRFDHRQFPDIRNGASVTFIDADGDRLAENVQPALAVARYMERAARGGALGNEQEPLAFATIMAELQEAASDNAADRQKRLRRLRETLDRLDL